MPHDTFFNRNAIVAEHAVAKRSLPLSSTAASSVRLGTSESPRLALLRNLLFPTSAVIGLLLSALFFAQHLTRPYFILVILAFALSWQSLGAADFRELRPLSRTEFFLPRVFFSWAKVLGVLLFVGFAAKASTSYSRAVLITWAIITPFLFLLLHALTYRMLCRWNKCGRIVRTHVIVGANKAAHEFAARLEHDASLGTFIGYFDDCANSNDVAYRKLLHIALPLAGHPRLKRTLEELRDTTVSIYFLLDLPGNGHSQTRIVEMAGTSLLAYFETPYCGLQGAAKRIVDILITSVLLALLWPLLLVIILLIQIDSPGPAIFRQRRYGLHGEEFAVYKFRSMRVCEDGAVITQARRGDPRITRIGQFLRRTSLDELPQLFCVLAGSMSLVGPRPHAVAHNEQYRRVIDGYMLRHKVRPGITGWAQVNGLRGETKTIEQMRARVAYDLDYLRHWSPWVDIKILWRTALLVVRDRNAY